jgi:hypothetical protein
MKAASESKLLQDLSEQVSRLKASPAIVGAGLSVAVLNAYRQRVSAELELLMTQHEDGQPAQLQAFLAKHWDSIKGSFLCYTVHPVLDVNLALYQAAHYVCAWHNRQDTSRVAQKSVFEFLLPGMATESTQDHYPDLCVNAATTITDEQARALRRLRSLKGLKQALSAAEESRLVGLNRLDGLVKAENRAYRVESGFRYPTVTPEVVFNTHILSEDGASLVPVALLLCPGSSAYNPYSAAYARVTEAEYERLGQHSETARVYVDSCHRCDEIREKDISLLGYLQRFIARLKRADSHVGVGLPEDVARSGYGALIEFIGYYRSLSEAEIIKVPTALKQEIEAFQLMASDRDVNAVATESMETCVFKRRQELERIVKANEPLLATIGSGDGNRQRMLVRALSNQAQRKENFEKELAVGAYQGANNLPLSSSMLIGVDILTFVNSIEDLQALMAMLASEIEVIFAEQSVQDKVVSLLDLQGLTMLMLGHSIIQLDVLFAAMGDQIKANFRGDLWRLLELLDADKSIWFSGVLLRPGYIKLHDLIDLLLRSDHPERAIEVINTYIPLDQRAETVTAVKSEYNSLLYQFARGDLAGFSALLAITTAEQQRAALNLSGYFMASVGNIETGLSEEVRFETAIPVYVLQALLKDEGLFKYIYGLMDESGKAHALTYDAGHNGSLGEYALEQKSWMRLFRSCFATDEDFKVALLRKDKRGRCLLLKAAKYKDTFFYVLSFFITELVDRGSLDKLLAIVKDGRGNTWLHEAASQEVVCLVRDFYATEQEADAACERVHTPVMVSVSSLFRTAGAVPADEGGEELVMHASGGGGGGSKSGTH